MCSNSSALVFIFMRNTIFDLYSATCLIPDNPLEFCHECASYYDTCCHCFLEPYNLNNLVATSLPMGIPSMQGCGVVELKNIKCYASKPITEGKLNVEICALVNCEEIIKGAENVCLRIHSECLTGDVFYSLKCDCGMEKLQFLQLMAREEEDSRPSILVYIKGHEGRGAGLFNKINAYSHVEQCPRVNHVDALQAVGCESDIRKYDAAARFIKNTLKVKSIRLFTNNPDKINSVMKYYDAKNVTQVSMPAVPSVHNAKYLKEKVELLGHKGLLENETLDMM